MSILIQPSTCGTYFKTQLISSRKHKWEPTYMMVTAQIEKAYRTHLRINLSRKLIALMYKPHNIKEMPPNFKEKYQQKLIKNKYKPRSILKCVRYIFWDSFQI